MNTERMSLADRARIHAALGDPARLAVVDTLVAGDAAPGELAAVLDMPTNLVAHHLKVLEDAGLVKQVSETAANAGAARWRITWKGYDALEQDEDDEDDADEFDAEE